MQTKILMLILSLFFFANPLSVLLGHEGHHHDTAAAVQEIDTFTPTKEPAEYITRDDTEHPIIKWIGQFHPIILHFPIALIIMTCISELLFLWKGDVIYKHASLFMIISSVIFVIPTVLTGLAFGYNVYYDNALTSVFWWHRTFGITTALLTIAAVFFLMRSKNDLSAYYLCLGLLFVSVSITGYLGG